MLNNPELLDIVQNLVMLTIAYSMVALIGLWLARPARTVNPFTTCGSPLTFHSGLTETLS